MATVNVHEAKTHFSKLLDRAQAGEEFVIAKAGKPVARLGPLARRVKKRRLGLLDGKFRIPDDFNDPLPEQVIVAFEGRPR
jgi:prevent-host-death family protein